MLVYRLEKQDYGVFCDWGNLVMPFSCDALYSEFGYSCKREYREKSNWRSACDSIDKLIKYFGSDFAYALGEGASVVEYVVNKTYVDFGQDEEDGNIEVIFDSTKATTRKVILTLEKEIKVQRDWSFTFDLKITDPFILADLIK